MQNNSTMDVATRLVEEYFRNPASGPLELEVMAHYVIEHINNQPPGYFESEAKQRNDPVYRLQRVEKLRETIRIARTTNQTATILVARFDIDIRNLVQESNVPAVVSLNLDDVRHHPGPIVIGVLMESIDPNIPPCCCNPVCVIPATALLFDGALKMCDRCKSANYCSIYCQRVHYPTHKPRCLEIAMADGC